MRIHVRHCDPMTRDYQVLLLQYEGHLDLSHFLSGVRFQSAAVFSSRIQIVRDGNQQVLEKSEEDSTKLGFEDLILA